MSVLEGTASLTPREPFKAVGLICTCGKPVSTFEGVARACECGAVYLITVTILRTANSHSEPSA